MSTRELRAAIIDEEQRDEEVEDSIQEQTQKKAEKALEIVIEVFELGGEPAQWLREELSKLLNKELGKIA